MDSIEKALDTFHRNPNRIDRNQIHTQMFLFAQIELFSSYRIVSKWQLILILDFYYILSISLSFFYAFYMDAQTGLTDWNSFGWFHVFM